MADKKVSDLPSLNGADVDPADLLYIVDSSAGAAGSKKITVGQYQLAPVSGGTANTVVYLNGSKVESSSSALTFDGTNLGIGTSSPGNTLDVNGVIRARGDIYAMASGDRIQLLPQSAGNGGIIAMANSAFSAYSPMTLDASLYVWRPNGSEQMRLDSSGNLGLGVTPSAWGGGFKVLEMSNGSVSINANGPYINQNAIFDTVWRYKANGLAAQYQQIAGQHQWAIAPSGTAGNAISFTQAMTLDASGNLDIGTTGGVDRYQNIIATSARLTFNAGTGFTGSAATSIYNQSAIAMVFGTNNTERARITSAGEVVVNETAAVAGAAFSSNAFSGTAAAGFKSNASTVYAIVTIWGNETSGNQIFTRFATDANQERGSIDYNRAGGLVRYNTTSDYRAKDIIGPLQNVGATIDALKVYEGVMKGATQSRPMLIAHEAQAHAPYAVSGVKDEVNEDGTPKLQQMDVSSLVPLLLAEIQSLRARVAALEAK